MGECKAVLLVGDNSAVLDACAKYLSGAGFAVTRWPSGKGAAGIPAFHLETIDESSVILMTLMTDAAGDAIAHDATEKVAPEYLSKPFDEDALAGMLDRAIARLRSKQAELLARDESAGPSESRARRLNTLRDEFDALLLRMQEPGTRERMNAAFSASADELGRAAVEAARKRA